MKHEEILTALEEISDKHINEAEKAPKRKMKRFFQVAVAAALVIAIGVNIMSAPARSAAKTIAVASERRWMEVPEFDAYENQEEWQAAMAVLDAEREMRKAAVWGFPLPSGSWNGTADGSMRRLHRGWGRRSGWRWNEVRSKR